jgi:hypothetical protein
VFGGFSGANITGSWNSDPTASLGVSSTDSNLFYFFLIFIPIILVIVYITRKYYKKKAQKKEISRIVRAWRAKFSPKDELKDKGFPDTAEVWTRPPGMVQMRDNPDPFLNMDASTAEGVLPQGTDTQQQFKPRASANIASPMGLPLPGRKDSFPAGRQAMSLPALKVNPGGVPMSMPPLQAASLPPMQRQSQPFRGGRVGNLPGQVVGRPNFGGGAQPFKRTSKPSFGGAQARSGSQAFSMPRKISTDRLDPFANVGQQMKSDPFARPSMAAPSAAGMSQARPSLTMPRRPSIGNAPTMNPTSPTALPPLKGGRQGTMAAGRPQQLPSLFGGMGRPNADGALKKKAKLPNVAKNGGMNRPSR